MRAKTLQLLLAPLILLSACGEETVTSPETAPLDPSFAKTARGGTANYDASVLDGGNGNVWAINDAGIAVGMARDGSGSSLVVRWVVTSEGVTGPEALPMLDGVFFHPPLAVNSSGEIAGYFLKDNRWGAFRFSDEQMEALPLFETSVEAFAWDINDSGFVVGSVESVVLNDDGSESQPQQATLWLNARDAPTVLPLPEGATYTWASARSINGEGLIVGVADSPEVPTIGLTWNIDDAGQLSSGPHTLPAGFNPAAVNAEGDIVGTHGACGSALLRGGALITLPTDETCYSASDLTDVGADGSVMVVSGSSFEGAVLWTVDGAGEVTGPVDLGNPKTTNGAYTRGINNQGWIVGAGRTNRGDVPALWLPKGDEGDEDGDCKPHPKTGKCR